MCQDHAVSVSAAPKEGRRALYNEGKGPYNDDDLQEIMDLLIAGVQPAE